MTFFNALPSTKGLPGRHLPNHFSDNPTCVCSNRGEYQVANHFDLQQRACGPNTCDMRSKISRAPCRAIDNRLCQKYTDHYITIALPQGMTTSAEYLNGGSMCRQPHVVRPKIHGASQPWIHCHGAAVRGGARHGRQQGIHAAAPAFADLQEAPTS